ncbi:hypothetical protein PG186_002907 [Listeria monocytogenes]|nr:hypothetical protein [Listeria monocytogenes]
MSKALITELENELKSQIAKREDKQVFSGKHFNSEPVSFEEYILAYGEYLRRSNKIWD